MFTKKHYEFFALFYGKQIKTLIDEGLENYTETWYQNMDSLITEFKENNPRFQEKLFRQKVDEYIEGKLI